MKNRLLKDYYNIHTVWFAMLLLTVFSYAVGKFSYNGMAIVSILLLTTVIKGIFIIRDFMELQGVSLLWRVIMYGWLWSVILAITISYAVGIFF